MEGEIMKRLIFFLILLIIAGLQDLPAQKRKSERAFASFKAGEYYDAIDQFKDAYSKSKKADKATRTELGFMVAECYRLTNDPKNAETWYRLAVKSSFSNPSRKTVNINRQSKSLRSLNRLLQLIPGPTRRYAHVNCHSTGRGIPKPIKLMNLKI
jgi:hypothetical protein